MLPTGGGDPTGGEFLAFRESSDMANITTFFSEAALGVEKDPVAGKERTGTTRRRTLTMRSPRVAGAEEGSRDLTVLATSGAEENQAMTRALPPQETRLTARYVIIFDNILTFAELFNKLTIEKLTKTVCISGGRQRTWQRQRRIQRSWRVQG